MENKNLVLGNVAIVLSGAILLVLAYYGPVSSSPMQRMFEAVGWAVTGYAPIRFFTTLGNILSGFTIEKAIDRLFQSSVRIVAPKSELPLFIAMDIEGCITPPHRTKVDLRKFQQLRGYCEFVKSHPEFPQIVIYTGRSQGYVELLAQSLDLLDTPFNLPFVIENGAALYQPNSKKTIPLITREQDKTIQTARALLVDAFPDNEFEPKAYMITINPYQETIEQLRDKIRGVLRKSDLLESFTITSSASAVDITPNGVTKLSGLNEVLKYDPRQQQTQGLKDVVAIGDHVADLDVIKNVKSAFCPAKNVHPEVQQYVEMKYGSDHIIDLEHIDFVINVIDRVCDVRIT